MNIFRHLSLLLLSIVPLPVLYSPFTFSCSRLYGPTTYDNRPERRNPLKDVTDQSLAELQLGERPRRCPRGEAGQGEGRLRAGEAPAKRGGRRFTLAFPVT